MGAGFETLGTLGIVLSNIMLMEVRLFASRQGFKVRWWSRSYAPERGYLRTLATTASADLAARAILRLRIERLAWFVLAASLMALFGGVWKR